MTTPVLTVRGLRKTYRGRRGVTANDGIDLDVAAHPTLARALAAAQPQSAVPLTGLTPRTAIEIVGRLRGGRPDDVTAAAARLVDALDLGEWADTRSEKLSGGVARLTAFAMTVVTPAPLVILDEPTNDVDPVRRRLLWAEIRRLAAPAAARYLATGAPTITLVVVGLVMTPQAVATARTEGSHDWMRSLPVPRSLFLVADLALWTVLALPGVVMGVLAGAVRFDVTLDLAWWLPLAVVVVSMTSAAVGYAIALTLAPPIAMLLSQVLVFFVLLFSPISFPRDRMPGWLATAHDWLPVEPMAQAVRAGLARSTFDVPARSVVVLGAWCVASVVLAALALRRRS